jgi:hypothetical protein
VSKQKLRIHNTQLDNLISNLRGEVGEVITSWVLLRYMMAKVRELSSDDIGKDMRNESLIFVSMLRTKLADEIVARLSFSQSGSRPGGRAVQHESSGSGAN